ncbi:GPN2 [Cervus elaphus hippelaphus]|uniref:GPN-loop GTPase 2 n=1 Tax=Cervus elaphus hippelaphus TaxID=46360 RepID=A0A212D3N9_CEREH|nr:GPN2 [Cervus elaphus hippelaphus]
MAGAAPTTAFGQAVIGPPGSGKTTYCLGMSEFLRALGRRVAVVNLDPANEGLPYECAVDVGELVGLGDVMDSLQLGPNGGLLYCMEYLEANLDWLRAKLDPLRGHYFLFDCPGQLTAVHLVDSHYCTDPAKFISVLCTSLATMLHVELPHDKDSIQRVLQAVDKANGYCFGVQEQRSLEAMMSAAMGADFHFSSTLGLQEKYLAPSEQSVEQEAMQL